MLNEHVDCSLCVIIYSSALLVYVWMHILHTQLARLSLAVLLATFFIDSSGPGKWSLSSIVVIHTTGVCWCMHGNHPHSITSLSCCQVTTPPHVHLHMAAASNNTVCVHCSKALLTLLCARITGVLSHSCQSSHMPLILLSYMCDGRFRVEVFFGQGGAVCHVWVCQVGNQCQICVCVCVCVCMCVFNP